MEESRGKHLETLLVILTGFVVMYFITDLKVLLYVGVGLSVVGLMIPLAAKYIHWLWMGIAKVGGFVNSHLILGLVFFLFLTPLALLRRLGRKDRLQLRKKADGSYYAVRDHAYGAKDLEKPW